MLFAWMSCFRWLCRFVRAPGGERRHPRPENLVTKKYETHEQTCSSSAPGGAGLSAAIAALAMACAWAWCASHCWASAHGDG